MVTASTKFKLLLSLVCFVCIWGQFDHDEWTPDEPRVVAIAMEMAETGNLIIPHLAGAYFIEKPPLYFAVAAAAISALPFVEPITAIRCMNIMLAWLALYFTYLLGKALKDRETGYLAAIVLGTMEGFVTQTHWSRVDNLLIVAITAATWAFYYAFKHQQHRYILLGAFFTGLAFLTKGLIGVVMIGAIWCAAVLSFTLPLLTAKPWLTVSYSRQMKLHYWTHLAGLCVFSFIAGSWIFLLKQQGTEEIWHEWFWVNHVGRFTGTANNLGHIHPGKPSYYLSTMLEYTLPWFPLLIAGAWLLLNKVISQSPIKAAEIFIVASISMTVMLLTVSDTKRGLYLFPLLPVFAVAVAYTLKSCHGKWMRYFQHTWFLLTAVIMLGLLSLPLYATVLASHLPAHILTILTEFDSRSLLVFIAFITLMFIWKTGLIAEGAHKIVMATALLYISALGFVDLPVNMFKSMRADTRNFVEQVPAEAKSRVAGYQMSETSLAALVISDNWKLPVLKTAAQVGEVLSGQNPDFDSVIIEFTGDDAELQQQLSAFAAHYSIAAIGRLRSDKVRDGIYWVQKNNCVVSLSNE